MVNLHRSMSMEMSNGIGLCCEHMSKSIVAERFALSKV